MRHFLRDPRMWVVACTIEVAPVACSAVAAAIDRADLPSRQPAETTAWPNAPRSSDAVAIWPTHGHRFRDPGENPLQPRCARFRQHIALVSDAQAFVRCGNRILRHVPAGT